MIQWWSDSLVWNLLTWKLTNHCNEYFMNMILKINKRVVPSSEIRWEIYIHQFHSHPPICMHVPRARNEWWKYLQITAVVYFMKTTARLSQWLARNHVHIYHIFETYGIHKFSSFTLKHQLHSTEIIFFLFTSNWTNFNIFARALIEINTSIQVKMASFIKTRMKLQSDKKKLNV